MITIMAIPHDRVASTSWSAPASNAGWQNPLPASTSTTAARGVETTGTASPTTLPQAT